MLFYHQAFDAESYAEKNSYGDDDRKAVLLDEAKKHFKLGRPHHSNLELVDGKVMLKKPRMFWQMQDVPRLNPVTRQTEFVSIPVPDSVYVEWVPGSITLSLPEVGMARGGDRFWVIPPGGCVDVPNDIPVSTVKDVCPHLITEAEKKVLDLSLNSTVLKPSPTISKKV